VAESRSRDDGKTVWPVLSQQRPVYQNVRPLLERFLTTKIDRSISGKWWLAAVVRHGAEETEDQPGAAIGRALYSRVKRSL
jgi:hypothetical protein